MAVKRRVPKVRDLAPLIQFKRPEFDRTKRRLDAALTIEDLRRIAKRRTPKAAFDYTDGAAEDELSIQRARQAFRDIEFHPTILRDVTNVATGWNVLGQPVVLPFAIAPTGFTRLMHTEGEIAGARAAAPPGSRSRCPRWPPRAIEDVVTAVPQGRKWFQLYMWRDRDRSMALVQARGRRRIRHPAGHRRRSGRRCAAARYPQRDVDPAGVDAANRARRGAAPEAGGSIC